MNDINYDLGLQLDQLEQSLVKWRDFHHYNNIKLVLTDDLLLDINNVQIVISENTDNNVLIGYLICDILCNQWLWELYDKQLINLKFHLYSDSCSVIWNELD